MTERFVAVTMVAFGTSVPELVASLVAARKGESDIVIGTMLELMETYNAPSFPVHDSLIVRKSDQELAMRVLSE